MKKIKFELVISTMKLVAWRTINCILQIQVMSTWCYCWISLTIDLDLLIFVTLFNLYK